MDFSHTCSRARRILVDWEDKGLVDLLDMDRILCTNEDGTQEVIDIRNCRNCSQVVIESEEHITEDELETWIRWSVIGRINFGESGDTKEGTEE